MEPTHIDTIVANLPQIEYVLPWRKEFALRSAWLGTLRAGRFGTLSLAETYRLVTVWSFFESAWHTNALGDAGMSCGPMQTWYLAFKGSPSCDDLRKDPVLAYAKSIEILQKLFRRCGTVRGALRAYASGSCKRADSLVLRRCRLARVACH